MYNIGIDVDYQNCIEIRKRKQTINKQRQMGEEMKRWEETMIQEGRKEGMKDNTQKSIWIASEEMTLLDYYWLGNRHDMMS